MLHSIHICTHPHWRDLIFWGSQMENWNLRMPPTRQRGIRSIQNCSTWIFFDMVKNRCSFTDSFKHNIPPKEFISIFGFSSCVGKVLMLSFYPTFYPVFFSLVISFFFLSLFISFLFLSLFIFCLILSLLLFFSFYFYLFFLSLALSPYLLCQFAFSPCFLVLV